LKAWLNLTTEEVARLVGTSKGAVYYWQRVGAEPRAGVARKIARVHSLLRALRNSTTPPGFQAVLRAKPSGYDRSVFDLLLSHDFETAEALLHDFVFAGSRSQSAYGVRQMPEWPPDETYESKASAPTLKLPRRTRHRVRLRKRD
jgi:transcriptional regulator with XRE-family HTH domain